ncbi:MAG TPA: type II toxin-antitoxin system VapC family toxin [Gaiella sp.]|nr:type II toxin-antitoxin system VapC family toxin [Gaiella sp.]
MKLLLDTHVVLWWLQNAPLRVEADEAIREPRNDVVVSAASAWEIGIKTALGKLRIPHDLNDLLASERLTPMPVTIAHGLAVGTLPPIHTDPFDRLLVAQAQLEQLTIVTRDERLRDYGVPIIAA